VTSIYELSGGRAATPAAANVLPPGWQSDGVARWVRLVDPPENDMEAALRGLDLPGDVLAIPPTGDIQPRVAVHAGIVLVTMPVFVPEQARPGVLRLIGTPTALITVESKSLPVFDEVVAELHHHKDAASLPGLFVDVVQAAIKGVGPVYLALRRSIDALADAIDERPLEVSSEALLTTRRRFEALSMLWEDQGYCCLELQRRLARLPGFDATREQLRDLVADSDRGMRLLPRIEARLYEIREHYENSLTQQTNRRLNMLAILSAVYMPATLIAGIYGMNLRGIPISDVPYGYAIVMAVMVAVVAAHFWYFSRRGWFR